MPGVDQAAGAGAGAAGDEAEDFSFNPFEMLGGIFGGGPAGAAGDPGVSSDSKSGTRRGAAGRIRDARAHVTRLITVIDALVVKTVDPLETLPPEYSPSITQKERGMIEEPLAEIVAESKQLAKIAGVSSMLSLSVGCGMWGWRVYAAYRYKALEKRMYEMGAGVAVAPAATFPPREDDNVPKYTFIPDAPEWPGDGEPHSTNGVSDGINASAGGGA